MDIHRILVVDDEDTIRHVLVSILEEKGCEIRDAESAEQALDLLRDFEPAVALVDIVLPGMNGIQLLSEIKQRSKDTEVLVMTSHATTDTALEAMRRGAYDYLHKPFEDLDEIWITVERALEKRSLTLKNRALLEQQEQRSARHSSALAGDPVAATDDLCSNPDLLDFFVELVVQELDVDQASLMLLHGEGELRIAASRGMANAEADLVRIKVGEGISGSVVKTGEPVLTSADADRGTATDPSMNVPIAMSVPLKSGETVLGVINVAHRPSGGPFDPADVDRLTSLAGQIAVAVEEARRVEQLRRSYESLRATQNQHVFADRVKALGQMAVAMANDFNNVLNVILARAEFALKNLDGEPADAGKIRSDLETIMESSLQGAATARRLQDYARSGKHTPDAPVNLKEVIQNAVEIARPAWEERSDEQGRRIDIQFELQDVPPVSGNLDELTQVVGNLIFNAVEAMPDGGRLTVRTRAEESSVVFEVTDTGIGMDDETQKKLSAPFFTTKEAAQGLGASIASRIISRHKGEIIVDSRVGEGTTFIVRIPRAAPESAERGRDDETEMNAVPARALLVDDDELVRLTFEEALASSGHEVVAVPSGESALATFKKQRYDVVITDLSMPGISGLELAKKVKRLDPDVHVILLTGCSIQQEDPRVQDAGIDQVVAKPCLVDKLLDVVQRVIQTPLTLQEPSLS